MLRPGRCCGESLAMKWSLVSPALGDWACTHSASSQHMDPLRKTMRSFEAWPFSAFPWVGRPFLYLGGLRLEKVGQQVSPWNSGFSSFLVLFLLHVPSLPFSDCSTSPTLLFLPLRVLLHPLFWILSSPPIFCARPSQHFFPSTPGGSE